MAGKILVAYATRYGSTQEVAEAAAEEMHAQGTTVDVKPAASVSSLEDYDAVVLATPFYIGSMLKDATEFLDRHRAALEKTPVALLATGPVQASDDMNEAREQIDRALAKLEWFKPVVAEMFVGKYDPERLRMRDKLVAIPPASPLHGLGAHDDRDWAAIRAWAATVPVTLQVKDGHA